LITLNQSAYVGAEPSPDSRQYGGFTFVWGQARSEVLKFGGAKYIFREARFFFIIFLKQIFLRTRKFGGHCPECPVATGLWGALLLCRGGLTLKF